MLARTVTALSRRQKVTGSDGLRFLRRIAAIFALITPCRFAALRRYADDCSDFRRRHVTLV